MGGGLESGNLETEAVTGRGEGAKIRASEWRLPKECWCIDTGRIDTERQVHFE